MSEAEINVALAKMGYAELRPKQEAAVIGGEDVFVSLPTGSGKSLCYSLLPLVFDKLRNVDGKSVVVVVSPLIALMKDQVRAASERNVRAVYAGEADDVIDL